MQYLILIRGLPGSGKSTLAVLLAKAGFLHFEADQYFVQEGKYNFNATHVAEAHAECLRRTQNAIANGFSVVVANTFTRQWEMAPYHDIAKKHNLICNVYTAGGDFENIHNVPPSVIASMRNRWEG